jgi:hypothetical protein
MIDRFCATVKRGPGLRSSTPTTRSMRRMGASCWRSGMRITTSAVSRRYTSITGQAQKPGEIRRRDPVWTFGAINRAHTDNSLTVTRARHGHSRPSDRFGAWLTNSSPAAVGVVRRPARSINRTPSRHSSGFGQRLRPAGMSPAGLRLPRHSPDRSHRTKVGERSRLSCISNFSV